MGFIPIAQLFLCTVQKRKEAGVGKPAAGRLMGIKELSSASVVQNAGIPPGKHKATH